jgi:hypothetical protein
MSTQAKQKADNVLKGLNGKISQNELIKLKKLSNFENINNELEALERIEAIKAWAQQSQD